MKKNEVNVFKLEVVLSSIYGILLCDIGEVYKFLNFVLKAELFTHQLPKAGRGRELDEEQLKDLWKMNKSPIEALNDLGTLC